MVWVKLGVVVSTSVRLFISSSDGDRMLLQLTLLF